MCEVSDLLDYSSNGGSASSTDASERGSEPWSTATS